MPKQLNVNLGFTADTSQAKAQLQDLQKQLTNLINNPKATSSIGLTKEIQEASVAAATLKTQLQEATNVNTGKLDLGKLNQSLKQSGYEIKDYKNALLSLGPEGQQAFATLAQSISLAEVPLRRSNALLAEFSTALKNTTRWQISSSVVHGFMGSVQSAYRYAQDLNESLNNIRIVSGQTTDQMADFAKQANASAKALSTTTTAYTDAALIFYQQGLTGDEVTERTDTVIKMANVTGQSAEEVSSYMTAIWNNFYDGSESLEHYADVITALGASTASSSEEIAEGLSKFASVADTIGLSYDYATSILAALVANTRQSADVIGTSLKTILARLQSLKLGETLEDGVELTKYTSALDAIGVSVLDLNGNLKDADDILTDTAAKWDTLTNAQQAAVAQTVAGTRQYAQFIAMMENWDDVELNLATAEGADNSLQDQADIYAESWEAASKRVKASAQDIYDSLLNDKFFIELNNVFAGFLDTIGSVIDGLGGVKGVLLAVGSIFLKVYRNQAAEALQNVQYSFMMMTKTGREEVQKLRAETNKELKTLFSDDASVKGNMMGEAYATQASVQEELLNKAKSMTEEQQKIAQILLDQHTTLVQNVAEQQKLVEKAEEEANVSKMKGSSSISKVGIDKSKIDEFAKLTKEANTFEATIEKAFGKFDSSKIKTQIEQLKLQVKSLRDVFKEDEEILDAFGKDGKEAFISLEKAANDASTSPEVLENKLLDLYDAIEKTQNKAQGFGNDLRKLANDSGATEEEIQKATNVINNIEKTSTTAGQELGNMAGQMVNVETSAAGFGDKLNQIPSATNKTLQGLVQIGQALSTVAMAISSVSSLVETWKGVMEGTVEPGQAVIQTLTTLGFVVPTLVTAYLSLNGAELAAAAGMIPLQLGMMGEKLAAIAAGEETATFGTILYSVLWPIGLVMAAIGLLIGTVWLLVKAFKAITSSPVEEKLKKAEEQAQQSAEAFDRVAESVKSVKDKLDELTESYDTIDQLKKGTDEWYEAVQNVNYEISKLLDKYPDLSNYIYDDDGLLRISQQGIDMIDQVNNERLQTANNIKLNDQRAKNEAKMDANWGDLDFNEQAIASVAQQYYNNPQGGDMVFTREAAEDITDALFGSLEDYTEGYDDKHKHYGEERYNERVDWVEDFINENEEVIKSNKQLADANQQIIDTQLAAKMSILGSNRTAEQTKELLGENAYQDAFNTSKTGVEERFGNWNDHIDYSEDDSEWKDIQKFMDLQGDDVEYVAQKWGKMILKIGEEEKEFTKEQVYNALAEAYSNEELETMVHQKLQENLGQVLTNVDMGSLNTDTLINLDNLHLQLEQALSNIDSDSVEAVFDKIVTSAGTSVDAIESMANKFTSIDWGNVENLRKFNAAAQELESGKMTIDEFTNAIDKMVAATELEGMDDFFKNAADSLGLKEEDAEMMKEYARNLMEFSEEAGGVSEQLATNANSAADLAVEIYRMNKGIDALADGFEDWNDIITKSNKESQEYSEAMYYMKQALSDVLDVESDLISSHFVEDHLEEIKKAAEGDADAIDALRANMDEEIIANITVGQSDDFIANVMEAQNDLNDLITNMDIDDIEVGAIIDDADFIAAANNLVDSASMTADEANAYFAGIGYEPVYSTEDVENANSMQIPKGATELSIDHIGWSNVPIDLPDWFPGDHHITLPRITYSAKPKSEDPVNAPADMRLTSFSGDGKPPKIRGMRKKATGSQNNYSSSNSGGKSPGSSGKKGGGGGGKKGGGGKTPEHKTKEKVDKFEADLFHKVNQELEDVEHNLKMIDKQQSHMFGKELINNLKQQNAQLKKQTELHKEKLAIAQREADVLRAQLKAQGVAFDGDNIANYNAMLQAAENQINALINQYNALSAAEQEAYDNAYKETKSPIQKAEDYYEELKKQMDKYTDYMSTVYSEEEAIQDALFQQIENNLKAYQVKIEVKLDMSEARRAMNKFLKDMSTDIKNMYKTSAEWATAFKTSEKDAGTYEDDINTKLKQLEDYKNASVGSENDIFATESEKYKAITDLEKEILEDSDNLLNEYQTAYDNLRDAFGEVADQFNEILDQFDSINDTLDHYAKVIELLYGGETDNGRKQLAEVYSLQKENSLERQDAMRKWGDELQKRRAEAIANGYDEDDSYIKDIDAQIEENSKNLESEIENYIDTIQRELENSIKMAQSQMDKSIWGASMADVRQEWDDKKAMADGYYDSVERIYQLESLESKWKAAITNTSSLKAQQQLAAIMDKQVASLESKNALSEKDIELAEKELAVYQAQIALEEAQNNKNSMKLTRDETGNWSYQYVADEDDIADKQQSYLDKVNEWRTASISAAEEITEKTMDAYEAFSERMTEIMNDVTLSEEERDAKIAELNATYWGEDGIITKLVEDSNYIQSTANQSTYVELAGLYEADQANLERMSEAEKTIIENMTAAGVVSYKSLRDYVIGDDGKSGMYGEIYDLCKQTNENSSAAWKSMAASAINRMYKDPNSVSKTVKQAYIDMEGALKIYNKAVENSEKASGIEWSKVGSQLDGVQKKIKETGKRVDEFTSKLKALGAFEKAVLRIKETWDKTSGSIKKATSDLEKYYKLLSNGKSNSTSSGGGGSSNTGGGSTSQGSGGDGKLTVGETVTYTGGTYYYDSYGTSPAGKRGPGKKVKVTSIKEDGRPYPIHVMSTDSAYGWLTKGQLSGYDTGGYTGDWAGGDGRLALLHSKELVLNKDDTKNILDTVQILRQFAIKDLAQSVGDAISYGLNSLIGKALDFNSNNYDTTQVNNNTNEEQNVTINVEAVFPHADDINEIREAILSLPNYASQFKMRK